MVAIIITILPLGIIQAQTTYSPFHDVPTTHWALPHIVKSEIRGVVSGYGNGVFKPDQTVTQLEAVVMAVRAMGLEKDANDVNQYVDTSALSLPTTWNARGFASVAIKKNLIDTSTFRHDAGASRAWTAQLLIRMIGMQGQLDSLAKTTFKDDNLIPIWAKPSVALAVEKGIISGMANPTGGFDYKPNDAVTRAQLATLISRSDRYMNDVQGQLPLGTIEKIDNNQITIVKKDNTKAVYRITTTSSLYNANYSPITTTQLVVNEPVRFQANAAGDIRYIEIVNRSDYNNLPQATKADAINGSIVQVYPEQKVIIVKQENNTLYTGSIVNDTILRNSAQNRSIVFADLQVGDTLELTVNGSAISTLNVTKAAQSGLLKGLIFAVDIEKGLLTLENSGRFSTYTFDDTVSVEYAAVRFATIRDLKKGDEIEIQIENEKVKKVKLITPFQQTNFSGSIVAVATSDNIVTILTSEATPKAYRVNNNTVFSIPDIVSGGIKDLEIGDQVTVAIDGQFISKISVTNRPTQESVKGQIVLINTTLSMITIELANKELRSYKYDNTLELQIESVSNPRLSDLSEGTYVALRVDKNTIRKITVNNTISGIIEGYDKTRNTVTIKHDGGTTTYTLDTGYDIHIFDINRPVLEDLTRGMEVIITLNQNRIRKIEVNKSITSMVTAVITDWDRLEIEDPTKTGDKVRYYIYDSVKFIIPGITNPKLSDFKVKDAVKIDFVGYDIKQIQVLPTMVGSVVSVDTARNIIDVRSRTENKNVAINNKLEVFSPAEVLMSISNLKANDYVKVITMNDKTKIYQTTAVDVEFYSVTQNRVYYYDSARSFRNMELDRDVQIWKDNTYYLPGDLKQGNQITMYHLNNQIIGIRVK